MAGLAQRFCWLDLAGSGGGLLRPGPGARERVLVWWWSLRGGLFRWPSVVLGSALLLPAVCWPFEAGGVLSAAAAVFFHPLLSIGSRRRASAVAGALGLQLAVLEAVCFLRGEQTVDASRGPPSLAASSDERCFVRPVSNMVL